MELSTSRKLLSIIISVLLAFSTAAFLASAVAGQTLSNSSYVQKFAANGTLVAECDKQLSAKYALLAAESGIPETVFETVKKEYPIDISLKTAFQNLYGNETATLYSRDLVDYFERLCTDYLDGNKISYQKEYVRNTAVEAARIFSETVGLHNVGGAADKQQRVRRFFSGLLAVSFFTDGILAGLLMLLYTDKKKAQIWLLSGLTGGAGAAAFGAFLCLLRSPARRLQLTPAVYQSVFSAALQRYFLLLLALAALLTLLLWLTLFFSYRTQKKKGKA